LGGFTLEYLHLNLFFGQNIYVLVHGSNYSASFYSSSIFFMPLMYRLVWINEQAYANYIDGTIAYMLIIHLNWRLGP
ncbi:hypothetical protein ACJX0J_013652, partial [Zea mays]